MTAGFVHAFRMLRWGRTLARHGALREIEIAPQTPPLLRRIAKLARFGTGAPKTPHYADAFQALGPAAIKLGQALATRPDLVGPDAAKDLTRLQDNLPPAPFAAVKASIEEAFGVPLESLYSRFDEVPVGSASVAQVHRAVTTDGRAVAVKVLKPGIEADFARAIETYEWAAVRAETIGGELARLRPRATIAYFRRWVERELNLRMEAASASELAAALTPETGFVVPEVDWARTSRRVLTIAWIDGVKLTDLAAVDAAGIDRKLLSQTLVRSFLRQAIGHGFFHADLHQGNMFALPDGRLAVVDFGIMGRINRQARLWLAEILHGLLTGNYARVAEIHFEAQYVPPHHDMAEFETALRSIGEPIRGLPVKDISIGNMLDGLFAVTRQFDMVTQPHLLLLQKTMVMVEGVALALDPDVNMWEISGPFVGDWMRDELGPEAVIADRLVEGARALAGLPDLLRRLEATVPNPGAAPPLPPLAPLPIRRETSRTAWLLLGAGIGVGLGWLAMTL
ncbi:2-polyprenylphenol 6-hydroxylase [Sphingosinicella sp.]|uniref:2-polyprenylphenol 6-hydroxylase n=1 Tax=Sphingosinicella sp. TaxID=1917971 RepID=UPI0017AB06E3|nr:2-polyprenylphenol 6-hydroxylase [Sphingosinicella sp.]MBA4758453.1 2-polyprenylphenol 6-hydroxylase [Sphingosinicella sp.]